MSDFLTQLTPIKKPVKQKSGDILFATLYKLGETYNVYVMTTDLPKRMTFIETEKYLNEFNKKNKNNWQIPDMDILKIIYGLRNKDEFKNTFTTKTTNTVPWYWSRTVPTNDPYSFGRYGDFISIVSFSDGYADVGHKDSICLRSRPVRIELVK
jgi:hypothetical protein